MTFVVTESCIRCKYTDCVDVCPVDAFREGDLGVPILQSLLVTVIIVIAQTFTSTIAASYSPFACRVSPRW